MATYTKLRSGEWGIKVQGSAKEGQSVTVTKKSGETRTETIAKVVWSGNGVSICAITNKGGSRRGAGKGGICAECEEPRRNLVACEDSSGIVALCCPRCASLPAYQRSFA